MSGLQGPFAGGPHAGKPFIPTAGGGGVTPAGDIDGFFVVRRSSDQNSNFAVNEHFEWNVSSGSGIATLTTGVGQAGGLITINETGDYYVAFSIYMVVNEGTFEYALRYHPSDVNVTDRAGQEIWVVGYDNVAVDASECAGIASIVSLNAGDVIKLDMQLSTNPIRADFEMANLVLLKVG